MANNRKILAVSFSLFILLMLSAPAPAAAVWTPQATTTENNTLPTGLSLPDNITVNLTYQTTQPTGTIAPTVRTGDGSEVTTKPTGSVAITARDNTGSETNTKPTGSVAVNALTGDGSEVTTKPTGSVAITARDNTGSETNTKPTGSVAVNALTGDGSEVTTKPTGSVAITARDNDGSEANALPSGANNPNAQAVNASSTITEPDADVRPAEQLVNSTIDNVKPTGAPTPNTQAITVTNQAPTNEPASLLAAASDAENKWYRGDFVLSTLASSLVVDDGGTGAFDNIYLDLDNDGTYAEDQSGNSRTVGSLVNENEDIYIENVRKADNFTIDGIYYKVSLASGFGDTDNTVFIKSNTWCTGSWSVDTDNDGVLDSLYFVIVDNNSDDNFDMIVISFNNTDYGEGDLADGKVLAGNDENLWATGGDLTVGAYNFNLTTLAKQPEAGKNDAGIKMDTWYYNAKAEPVENVLIDNEGSGTLRNLYYCIWDPDSNGIFENVALSIDDTNFGEGSLNNKILGPDDDESLDINSADNKIQISVVYDFNVWFTSDPAGEATDFSIDSVSWYVGHIIIDVDGNGNADNYVYFVLSDDNSDGVFDTLDISSDDNAFGAGTLNNDNVYAGDDEQITAADNLRIGTGSTQQYRYEVIAPVGNPNGVSPDFRLTSTCWYTGTLSIDVNGDGTLDTVNFALSDNDSNGIFNVLEISSDDTTYGENITVPDDTAYTDNDARITAAENVRIGTSAAQSYRYEVAAPVGNPIGTSDYSVKSTSWWTGVIIIDVNGDGTLDTVNFALSDNDSNGIFNVLEISSDDTTYGENITVPDDTAYTDNDARITAAENVRIGTSAAQQYRYQATLVGNPVGTTLAYDFRLTSTCWYTGTLSVDVDGDGTTDTVNLALSDSDSDGVFDTLDISADDTTYGEGTLDNDRAFTDDDDERLTAADNIRIGTSLSQSYRYEVITPVGNPIGVSIDYSVTSTSWWIGNIYIDIDGNGSADNVVYFVLSDGNSNGIFDTLDISSDDNAFGAGTLDNDRAFTGDDERLTAADNIRIGTGAAQQYRYEVAAPVGNPAGATPTYDFRLTSSCWYTGTLSIDVNDDGTADTVNFCLSDNNSDGIFDTLDISENATYGQNLTSNKVSSENDAQVTAGVDLFKFGDYNQFQLLGPVGNPIYTTPDFSVTSSSWYKGQVQVEMTGDNVKDNLYICLLDKNSDGVFDWYELSAFNDNFGQGSLADNLVADNLSDNNDERLGAATDNLHLGPQRVRYDVAAPVANPQTQAIDFRMRAKSWYVGTITLHAGNTFNFVIWDNNSDGTFDNLVFDDNSDGSYSGDPQYSSYPASPVRLPRGSQYAYKVVWFNRNPAYADATYGAYDLVMQPLDEASPVFSSPSPAQGTTTSDSTPTISVNLSDVGTGGYTFGIESITMQVRGQTVSHTYSGGVVSYTPTIGLWNGGVSVSVTASDYAKNSASTSWSFTVDAPAAPVSNMPPTADANGPYYVREGGTVQLDGTRSSDPEGDTLTYNWAITNDPTGAASLTGAGTATPTFHAPESAASVTVGLTVNDGRGGSDSSTATVTVLEKFEIGSEVTIDNIEAGGSVDATVENTLVTGLKITARNSVQNVRINVGQFAKTPSGVPAASGIPYRYIYVATENLAQQDVENVIMSFKVEKSWITGENINVDTIVLQRYNPRTGSWENLPTERTGEGADFVYFDATSTSLSVFAVVGETVPQPYVAAPSIWVIAIIAIVLVAVLLAVIWRYLSKSGPQSLKV